jgi:plastocyanin
VRQLSATSGNGENRVVRRASLLAVVFAALALSAASAGCGSSSSKSSGSQVKVADFSFSPKTIQVKPGTTVTWTNQGQTEHTVKGPGFFSAKALAHGAKYSFRFSKPGRFPYLCTLHPALMRGTVIVKSG